MWPFCETVYDQFWPIYFFRPGNPVILFHICLSKKDRDRKIMCVRETMCESEKMEKRNF